MVRHTSGPCTDQRGSKRVKEKLAQFCTRFKVGAAVGCTHIGDHQFSTSWWPSTLEPRSNAVQQCILEIVLKQLSFESACCRMVIVRMLLLEIAVEILWRGNSLAIVRAHLINIDTRNTKVQKLRNAKIQYDPSDVGIAVEILRRGNSLAIVRTHYNKPRQSITPAIPVATPAQHFPQWLKVCKFLPSKTCLDNSVRVSMFILPYIGLDKLFD